MPRTRIISQSKALYVSPTGCLPSSYYTSNNSGASGMFPTQLNRIDTFSFDVDIAGARTDVREFGQLARIAAVRLKELTPKVTFGYYLMDGNQEFNLGLNTLGISGANVASSQFISGIMTEDGLKKEKNLYLLTVAEGIDAFESGTFVTNRTTHSVIGFGNATLNSYKASFKVGEIPRADVEMECGNIIFYTGQSSGLKNPAINRTTAAQVDTGLFVLPAPSTGSSVVDVLRAGDMSINFSNSSFSIGGVDLSGISIQSLDIDVPLSRTPIEKLGDELPFAKPLDFPINVTCSISAFVTDFASGSLQRVLTGCVFGGGTDISISVLNRCANAETLKYKMVGAVLDSQNFSMGLEDNETVDLTFSAQIGGATSASAGIFMSGSYGGSTGTAMGSSSEKPTFISGTTSYANNP
jgi:hypothetical protein